MFHKMTLLGTLIIGSLLTSLSVIPAKAVLQTKQANRSEERQKAIAFLLGWNSKAVLVEKSAKNRQQYLALIKLDIHELGVVLEHPVEYYFEDPMKDGGERAQAFAEETLCQLKKTNTDIANHFGAAHNLLLTIAHREKSESGENEELTDMMPFLDIPEDLKRVPDKDLLTWAGHIKEYFESVSCRPQKCHQP